MHVYFSGIGGTAIGPLALIAKKVGYEVSGSDLKDSQYIQYLVTQGIGDIHIGQSRTQIDAVHAKKTIDWFVYTSALPKDHPELLFCQEKNIKASKRDEFLGQILQQKGLKLIAIAGTHGKTTTTAMVIWLFKQLAIPVSYSVGAKISFGDMGHFEPQSEFFVYEADEFDRNFLAFHPYLSLITGISWDHQEVFPTQNEYNEAFKQFLDQSQRKILWQEDIQKLSIEPDKDYSILNYDDPNIEQMRLAGLYNRRDGWLAAQAVHEISQTPLPKLIDLISAFPGLSRRFEKISANLYSDYAHTPDKIKGVMNVAQEVAGQTGQKIVVVYEPLTNRRMHYTADAHHNVFEGASAIYWVPSHLAREDPNLPILSPEELIKKLDPSLQKIAQPRQLDNQLESTIKHHLQAGDLVVALSGGGADSLDEWLRKNFAQKIETR